MLSAVRDGCGQPLPGVHSTKPVKYNFLRKWVQCLSLLVLTGKFLSVFWQSIYYILLGLKSKFYLQNSAYLILRSNSRKYNFVACDVMQL